MMREGLHEFAMEMVKELAAGLFEDEIARLCGTRYQHGERGAYRHGKQRGSIVVGGQKLPVNRPRARSKSGEIKLKSYELMQHPEAMPEAAIRRMVRGVSTRNYSEVIEAAEDGYGIEKSSVSRAFIRASEKKLRELRERRFENVRFLAILIDGKEFAGMQLVCALGVKEDGEKVILGLIEGATENATVTSALLEELRERGVDTELPTLFVLDGSKALRAAVERVFGENAVVQRCRVHKKRNVKSYLSDDVWQNVSERLNEAYASESYHEALSKLKTTVNWLRRIAPDAASSLEEGLEETLTLTRLGITGELKKTFATTNLIESAFSVCENVTGRVKRWRDGSMRLRWCAAGLLRAEEKFRKIRGHRDLSKLLRALMKQQTVDPIRQAA
jgi:transposase-like protein